MTLAGARIILTRPAEDSGELENALREAGAQTLSFPVLKMQASNDTPPAGPFDIAIFTSPSAVRFGLEQVRTVLPAWIAAPGQGTADCLRSAGVSTVIAPRHGAGLSVLLDAPVLHDHLAGARVLLICGRPLNRRNFVRLESCGSRPTAFCVYQRQDVTEAGPLADWFRRGAADAIMVSSVAAVEALAALGEREGFDWSGIEWIASSPRVAAAVKACNGLVGAVAASAHARALVAAASEWWSAGRYEQP
ncbi:MAG: uroporphyrinogen-III synthase [Gammaproteobacteria bacterium]